MELIFEKSRKGHFQSILPPCDVETVMPSFENTRQKELPLPEISENDLCRHYTGLMKRTFGVNDGFYPLGSCTMKYNPKINEKTASLPGFADIHPLQPENTVKGALEAINTAEKYLCEITGMDNMTFQPAAGAHGEFAGLLLIKAYHASRGDTSRTKIIIPDSAHGTNPASAAMAGFDVITIESDENGLVDMAKLKAAAGSDTAGLMLTNPNTLGLFDKNILEITKIIHDAGGLNYYDGANLNAILGIVRPGDMGFDVVHLNLHKSFSTPHGGGGPGSGPVGCKKLLSPFLPNPCVSDENGGLRFETSPESIGRVKSFYGNFLVVVKALSYILSLGAEGIPNVGKTAVLNANYMMKRLSGYYDAAYDTVCMHEFVLNLSRLKSETGVSALDIAKGLQDMGMHPPTMYFPLIVHEALMIEPTETESKETLDAACDALIELYKRAKANPQLLFDAPVTTPVGRLDEVDAARNPRINYFFSK